MAYAALVIVAEILERILPQDQQNIFLCDKEQIKYLHEKVIRLQKFLEDMSKTSRSSTIEALESRIRDFAYKLENIVEESVISGISHGQVFESEVGTLNSGSRNYFPGWLLKGCASICGGILQKIGRALALSSHTSPAAAAAFASYVEEADILLKDSMEMKKIHDNKVLLRAIHFPATSSPRGPPGAIDTKVGLTQDLNRIKDQLTRKDLTLLIVPITGMGGIGKTTLARVVYEDPDVQRHFDLCCWATVSHEYNILDVLQKLLPERAVHNVEKGVLIERLHKILTGRRFLIVLDDMWDEEVLDKVRVAFPDENKASRVIVTTRSLKVASYVCSPSTDVHQMQFLNEKESWDLLCSKVYGRPRCEGDFEEIGKAISRNCKGLPLAVVVIAGLLKFNKTKDYWEDVSKHIKLLSVADGNPIFEILCLSYTNLPPRLKACFLYMGVFPEDYEIQTKELVMLWTAEGFLKQRESKTIEEVAEECLEELVERSLVLVTKKRSNGKIRTASIHDVLRDLSLREAKEEKFMHHSTDKEIDKVTFSEIIKDQRRVCFSKLDLSDISLDTFDAPVRSFRNKYSMHAQNTSAILHFKLLRVLDRIYIRADSSLSILSRLNNLRYLHLVHSKDEVFPLMIPESISKLQNLEILFFSGGVLSCYELQLILPLQIWEMPRLKHLVLIHNTSLPFPVPSQNTFRLDVLQTLSGVTNFDFTESVLEKIPNLKKLKIQYSETSTNGGEDFHLTGLGNLHQLEELTILCELVGPVVTHFAFPHMLKKLTMERTRFPFRDMSLVGSLPNLKVLKLKWRSVEGKVWDPIDGEFLQLQYLKMEGLNLEDWSAESVHFPCLEKLIITSCRRLKEVPLDIGCINTLQKLTVGHNNIHVEESVKLIQKEQKSFGNILLEVNSSGKVLE